MRKLLHTNFFKNDNTIFFCFYLIFFLQFSLSYLNRVIFVQSRKILNKCVHVFFFASFYPLRCDNRLLSKCAITCTPKGERTTNALYENLHSNLLPFIWLVAINWLCGWRSIERFLYTFNTEKFYFNLFFFVWLSLKLIRGKNVWKNL